MGRYRLIFNRSVSKDLRSLPNRDVARILKRIKTLADDPRPVGCQKLSGQEKYRLRQGVYRVLYEIQDDEFVVRVVKIGHRRDVYRD